MEPRGPLASCEQKLFSSKNVPNPFALFKLKDKEGRGMGNSCTTGSSSLQPATFVTELKSCQRSLLPETRGTLTNSTAQVTNHKVIKWSPKIPPEKNL